MIRVLSISILALTACLASNAHAQIPDDVARIEVLPGWRDTDGRHIAALSVTLAPGWKTYWRAPGEGGIPPIFNWSGSDNLSALDVSYPVPDVFMVSGIRTFGYEDHVIFPLIAKASDGSKAITLSAQVDLGVCYDICIPVSVDIRAALSPSALVRDPRIVAAIADRPITADEAGLAPMSCRIEPISDGMRVTASVEMQPMAGDEVAVIEHPDPAIWVSEAKTKRSGKRLIATAEMVPPQAAPFVLARDNVLVTVLAGGQAVEIRGCD